LGLYLGYHPIYLKQILHTQFQIDGSSRTFQMDMEDLSDKEIENLYLVGVQRQNKLEEPSKEEKNKIDGVMVGL
jgi:hypothetical protein